MDRLRTCKHCDGVKWLVRINAFPALQKMLVTDHSVARHLLRGRGEPGGSVRPFDLKVRRMKKITAASLMDQKGKMAAKGNLRELRED